MSDADRKLQFDIADRQNTGDETYALLLNLTMTQNTDIYVHVIGKNALFVIVWQGNKSSATWPAMAVQFHGGGSSAAVTVVSAKLSMWKIQMTVKQWR